MNQILFSGVPLDNSHSLLETTIIDDNIDSKKRNKKLSKSSKLFFYSLFAISTFTILYFLFSYGLYLYHNHQTLQLSDRLSETVRISSIYSNSNTYLAKGLSLQDEQMIGTIEIPKLNIYYPIFSQTRDEFLKIAPCRFYGPLPNEVGNLCIAGHNYDNNKFFSKISRLKRKDPIHITDLNGNTIIYYVSRVYEVDSSDTSTTSQATNGKRELTLITCNNRNDNRIIVKALEET